MGTVIKNARIINEGEDFKGSVLIENDRIKKIYTDEELPSGHQEINAEGKILMPGVIDDQVHFREPGLTHKGEIYTEAKAAVAGGCTTFMEMPNTIPQTLDQGLLEQKYERASEVSLANFSFYMGASNDNLDEVLKTNGKNVCGVKVFMGSSTGNMLVDEPKTLEGLFKECPLIIASHCEHEPSIRKNLADHVAKYGDDIPIELHPVIRDTEACYRSSSTAAELASKFGARIHILHISTAKEVGIFEKGTNYKDKKITAEACVHHLTFTDAEYATKKTFIKWNPAVKSQADQDAIWEGLLEDRIDVVATDHAPHTIEEKTNVYTKAPSGGPLIQHSLAAMMQHVKNNKLSMEQLVTKMCHRPAELFQIKERGFIREGYFADLVLVEEAVWKVSKDNILYKCGWSPFEEHNFEHRVSHTFVNGHLVYNNGEFDQRKKGERVLFER
ncbi:MAG: dihydroorotase [Flavobacteriales bacterium]|nr:dihydroorotase [Flavobacteriales bacterium]